jgi:hypothetical protein
VLLLFDRTPVSRDRDCYSLAKVSEFYVDAKVLVAAKVLTIFSMAGQYNMLVQCGRESAHKSLAEGGKASLDVYMHREEHLHQGEVGDHQQGLIEVSCCRFCPA